MNDVIEHDQVTAIAPAPQPQPLAVQADNSQGAVMLRMIETVLLRPDFDVAKLNAMLDAKQRMDDEAARREFRRDFAGFRGENIIIPKTKHVDRGRGGSFEQAEYHVVAERISVALAKHGFSFRHDQRFGALQVTGTDGPVTTPWVWVTCYLEHRGGHSEKLELEGPPGDLSVNTPVQNMQVTASYLKRQSLLAITGTATGGEDDENGMRRSGRDTDDGPLDDGVDPALQAGHDAAMEGMKALTAWWGGLTNKQRGQWSQEFGHMRKAAAMADKGGAR